MRHTFSLATYAITINSRRNREDKQILSDWDKGIDFLDELYKLFKTWCYKENQEIKNNPVTTDSNDNNEGNAFRLAQGKDGTPLLHKTGRYLNGIIESGEFGTREELVDIDTGNVRFYKSEKDVLMKPFYFMFYVPNNAKIGFLIVERISNFGITTVLTEAIQNYFKELPKDGEYVLKIDPFSIKKLVQDKMRELKYEAKQIELRNITNYDFGISKISGNTINGDNVMSTLVFKTTPNKRIQVGSFLDKILNKQKNQENLYVIEEGLKCKDVAITLTISGKNKVFSLQNMQTLGMSMDITDDVAFGANRYPTFKSLDEQAKLLISYIIDQFPNLKNEAN